MTHNPSVARFYTRRTKRPRTDLLKRLYKLKRPISTFIEVGFENFLCKTT